MILIQPYCNMWNETCLKELEMQENFKQAWEAIKAANPHYGDQRFALDMAMKRELGFFRTVCKEPLPGVPLRPIPPAPPKRPPSASTVAPSCAGLRVQSPKLYGAARP